MTSPEITPQTNAAKRLYELANDLDGMGGPIDIRKVEPFNEEYKLARLAVAAVAGQPVVGNTSSSYYYSIRVPKYERNKLETHQHVGNDFMGIIKRLVNIDSPTLGPGTAKRFCLQVAPLAAGVDKEWFDFYAARGQQAQLRHPFGDPSKAGRSVWIPLDSMGERSIFFPEDPKASTAKPRRIPVW